MTKFSVKFLEFQVAMRLGKMNYSNLVRNCRAVMKEKLAERANNK